MAASQQHIIDRLRVEFAVSDPNRAHEIQEQVSSVLRQQLEPMLEELFNGRMPQDETIVIDHLELNLGSFSETELEHAFFEELQVEIEKELSELTRSELLSEDGIQQYSKVELYLEALSKYLQTGAYPWFISQYPGDDVLADPNNLYQRLFSQAGEQLLDLVREHSNSANFRNRLIFLLDDEQFRMLTNKLESSGRNKIHTSIQDVFEKFNIDQDKLDTAVKNVRLARSSVTISSQHLLNIFFDPFAEGKVLEQLLDRMEESAGQMTALDEGDFTDSLKEIAALYRLQKVLGKDFSSLNQFQKKLENIPPAGDAKKYLERLHDLKAIPSNLQKIKREVSETIEQKIDADLAKSTRQAGIDEKKQNQGLYIGNAGLILIWPFLPKFFRKLELTAERQFIDRQSRFRAFHILQYLATGERSTFEHVMVFNKVLCGYPVERPFPSEIEFSENELQESDVLLESAIEQWEALKSTSVEGFRQSFLQRNARLKEFPQQWELQVESKSFDVLLDKLPWGISVARLPWMGKPIYVNWR